MSDRRFIDERAFDRFPSSINFSRIQEAVETKPNDSWNYIKFQGKWFLKEHNKSIVSNRALFRSIKEEAGINFKNWEAWEQFVDKECSKPVYFTCDLCKKFRTQDYKNLESHTGNRMCLIYQKRLEAEQNKQTYVPSSKKPAYCGICKQSFSSKYVLEKHKKSQMHKEKAGITSLPEKCLVCSTTFDLTKHKKIRRHLKSAKKCHSKVRESSPARADYLWMHSRFRCKFATNLFEKQIG